ncbi:MAG: AMP-binding protein [Deltaproteobacteria bacterium]|nr:AMP-binding protein [Deltaproteobacteria bacterium]
MNGTIAEILRAHAANDAPALLFEDRRWTYREYVQACAERAALLLSLRRDGPFHVGVLLDNVPEYPMLLGAAALAGATIVGINPTRRGAELERDVQHSDCQIIVTEARHGPLLDGLDLGVLSDRLFDIDSDAWRTALERHANAPMPDVEIDPGAPYLLVFTSGTTGDPKAAICSQGRLALIGQILIGMRGLSPQDVSYLVMPFFHSNAIMAGWGPTLAVGAAAALRRKFSASGFLPDVRRHGVTYFNYVGKPLTYILSTPERPDDADNTLRAAFGNEAGERDVERFSKRFGCEVVDAYGSTEGGISISRTPDTPTGALGVGQPGTVILDPDTGQECPSARFDATGRLDNAEEAICEIANRQSAQAFEGYWNNPEANTERTHDGVFWSGDLGYRDEQGFLYFAGRNFDWLRVDGENFAAAPIERILTRHDDVAIAAVYAVPNADVGDDVMAALMLSPDREFDAEGFAAFLRDQADLGTKWIPRYLRVASELPSTPSNKILKRQLRQERWECSDPVWLWTDDGSYRRGRPEDLAAIRDRFRKRGRETALD